MGFFKNFKENMANKRIKYDITTNEKLNKEIEYYNKIKQLDLYQNEQIFWAFIRTKTVDISRIDRFAKDLKKDIDYAKQTNWLADVLSYEKLYAESCKYLFDFIQHCNKNAHRLVDENCKDLKQTNINLSKAREYVEFINLILNSSNTKIYERKDLDFKNQVAFFSHAQLVFNKYNTFNDFDGLTQKIDEKILIVDFFTKSKQVFNDLKKEYNYSVYDNLLSSYETNRSILKNNFYKNHQYLFDLGDTEIVAYKRELLKVIRGHISVQEFSLYPINNSNLREQAEILRDIINTYNLINKFCLADSIDNNAYTKTKNLHEKVESLLKAKSEVITNLCTLEVKNLSIIQKVETLDAVLKDCKFLQENNCCNVKQDKIEKLKLQYNELYPAYVAEKQRLKEEQKRREAEERARREEQARREAEERARREAEEKARKEAEEKARREAQAKAEAEEKARKEEQARREAEEKSKQESEEQKRKEQIAEYIDTVEGLIDTFVKHADYSARHSARLMLDYPEVEIPTDEKYRLEADLKEAERDIDSYTANKRIEDEVFRIENGHLERVEEVRQDIEDSRSNYDISSVDAEFYNKRVNNAVEREQ